MVSDPPELEDDSGMELESLSGSTISLRNLAIIAIHYK